MAAGRGILPVPCRSPTLPLQSLLTLISLALSTLLLGLSLVLREEVMRVAPSPRIGHCVALSLIAAAACLLVLAVGGASPTLAMPAVILSIALRAVLCLGAIAWITATAYGRQRRG